MPRLANKGTTQRAPQTGASVPELPDFSAALAEVDGGSTNSSLQRWWDLVRQRIEFNNGSVDGRFQEFTKTIGGITGRITVEEEITSRMKDYLSSRYTINVAAGAVLTGITVFSETGPDVDVSYIAVQADRFFVNTATGGNKQIFSVSATEVLFGNVLVIDLVGAKLYMGTGTYGNANTPFYVDTAAGGRLSLGSKFTWDGSTLTLTGTITATAGAIGGWVIGPTYIRDASGLVGMSSAVTGGDDIRFWAGNATMGSATFRVTEAGVLTATSGTVGGWTLSATTLSSASNVVIDSAGTIALGTSNDILYMSAADATYRIWAGNVTAGSASFSVTKAGALFSTSGTIGGFTIGPTSLTAGTGLDKLYLSSGGIMLGDPAGVAVSLYADVGGGIVGFALFNSSDTRVADFSYDNSGALDSCSLHLNDSTGATKITLDGATGLVVAGSFSGQGSLITTINASNISSGTLNNSRLPSAISVTSLTASGEIRGATARFGTFTSAGAETFAGTIAFTDDGGTARKLAVFA